MLDLRSNLLRARHAALTFAIAVGIVVFCIPSVAQSKEAPSGLQGTWRVHVFLVSCSTGQNLGSNFASLLTFGRGGTLTGTTTNGSFQPGQRTGDFGIWRKTGHHKYSADSEAFILFNSTTPPFLQSGKQRILQSITVDGDSFDSVAITRFYDTNNNLLTEGCAHALATRYQ
jgi:hypothetical protein